MNKIVKYGIELLVIIVILLAAFYGITKINTSLTRNNKQDILVTFEAQNQKEDILSKVAVGDKITDNAKTTFLGEVVAVSENKPTRRSAKNYEEQAYKMTPIEGYFDKNITVAIQADVSDTAIMVGETELKIGYMIPIINEKYLLNSTVVNIEIQDHQVEE